MRSNAEAPRRQAFVVHLIEAEGIVDEPASGRVEHVCSGRSARFASAQELVRFMRQTLSDLHVDDS